MPSLRDKCAIARHCACVRPRDWSRRSKLRRSSRARSLIRKPSLRSGSNLKAMPRCPEVIVSMLMISMAAGRRNDVRATRWPAVEVPCELRVNSPLVLGEITMNIRGAMALGAAGLSLTSAALAHHGFGNFDTKSEVALEGTITGIDFVNPHAYVYFDAV